MNEISRWIDRVWRDEKRKTANVEVAIVTRGHTEEVINELKNTKRAITWEYIDSDYIKAIVHGDEHEALDIIEDLAKNGYKWA